MAASIATYGLAAFIGLLIILIAVVVYYLLAREPKKEVTA